jgi:2,4-dienoyl-CoA reductase-like NADH-dependent reductase (Old Yellow Enzyme family)
MSRDRYPRVAALKTAAALRAHLASSNIALDFDDELAPPAESPLARPIEADGLRAGNRFCILPMEGWDGTREGEPSDLTRRRWRNFGRSGAKLIWGGEAVAVRHDGRASPNQVCFTAQNAAAIAALRDELIAAHRERFGANADGDLVIGLQLTHSGRFAKPDAPDQPAPLTASAHAVLDRRFPAGVRQLTDQDLDALVDDFIAAARRAEAAGFHFVDVKACHGYLGHELLGARSRPGRYGGPLDQRLRWMTSIIDGIRAAAPRLKIGVRLSVFDLVPYRKGGDAVGVPDVAGPDEARVLDGFGLLGEEMTLDQALADSRQVLAHLRARGVRWICVTAGSPYYCPHAQRPAFFPPADGYQPPEDPLRGVARQIEATGRLKAEFPDLVLVGSAYSYLQDWLPHVAQHTVRTGRVDLVGLGRLALSYPELPADVLSGAPLKRGSLCRTFSDCTTGPRMGFVSGCYPLDPFYLARPEAAIVQKVRTTMAKGAS